VGELVEALFVVRRSATERSERIVSSANAVAGASVPDDETMDALRLARTLAIQTFHELTSAVSAVDSYLERDQ
jgi:hypothetical protein